jgi:hypothetical protein
MSIVRARVDFGANDVRAQGPGDSVLDQVVSTAVTTVGNATLTAAQILTGLIERTGPTGNYADIFPSADSLLQAAPWLVVGDSFKLIKRNTVAFTDTPTGAEGVVLGTNTAMAASAVRMYLLTVLGDGVRQAVNAVTTNGSNAVTGLTAVQTAALRVGQGVTGTGIPANSYITSINQNTNSFTLNANATATGTPALTIFPRYGVQGVLSASL